MKKNLLIGYYSVLHYRIPLFIKLSEQYNITVLHSGKKMMENSDALNEMIVPAFKIGPFHFQPGFLKEANKRKYDIIIAFFDVAWITTLISIFIHNKKAKFILWGAWITRNKLANYIRVFLSKKVEANIFYTEQARKEFIKRRLNPNKLFVANNTFDVGERVHSYESKIKNRILFVGSLDERKQNDILMQAFGNISGLIPDAINLTIIGEGVEEKKLRNMASELGLSDRITFLGKINNIEILNKYYEQAILSVSFGQAGLSVLQALGYGVPFLTKRNAISGGEIYNIRHNYNGLLCDDNIKSLEEYLLKLCTDIPFARQLGKNAYNYYSDFCTMENMTQGFIDAIENTRLSKIDS